MVSSRGGQSRKSPCDPGTIPRPGEEELWVSSDVGWRCEEVEDDEGEATDKVRGCCCW